MNLEKIVKGTVGGVLFYMATSLLVPYYAAYATATKAIATGTGVYIGATYDSPKKSAHG